MNQVVKAAIKGETDFLRRKNNQLVNKQKRIKTIQVKGLHVFLVFTVLLSAAFVAYKAGDFILNWEKLNLKTFTLINKPTYYPQKLKHVLRQFHGNILTINFSELREKLLTIKEVRDVSLSRQLPSTIEIKFLLRKPVFQVAINGIYNIIDMEGVVLYTNSEDSNKLIEIRDVEISELEVLAPYLPELSRIKGSLDYISLKKPYGVTLKLKGHKEVFYPGETNFAAKINYYLKLRKKPLLRNYDIKNVDLRFKDRFYFEYETEVNN